MSVVKNIPDGWVETNLDSVTIKVTDGSHQSPKSVKEGMPMLSVKDMNEFGFDIKNSKKISKKDYDFLVKQGCKPNVDDILIAKDGSVLKHIFRVKEELNAVLLSSIAIISPNIKKIDPRYLVYLLANPNFKKYILNNFLSGSGVPRIVLKDFKKIEFIIPKNINEQNSIASILTAFDDKIELLQAQNKTLEETAQTVFEEWFGKYSVDDDLPKGWKVEELDDLLELIIDYRGKTPLKLGLDWSENGIPAISAKSIKNGKIVRRDAMNFGSEELYSIWMKDELKKGDILLTSEAPLGEMYYINDHTRYILSQRVFALRVNKKISSEYLFHYLFSENGQALLQARASGSTVEGIRQSELRKIEIIVPEKEILDKASNFFKTVFDKIFTNEEQIQTLIKTRNELLPRLMSGEILVKI